MVKVLSEWQPLRAIRLTARIIYHCKKVMYISVLNYHIPDTLTIIACLYDQNKSGFFGGSAFIQPIKTI